MKSATRTQARYQMALEALQAQAAAAGAMLQQKLYGKPQDRTALTGAQRRMKECEPETGYIVRWVMSGAPGKSIPELKPDDLSALIKGCS